MGLLVFQQSGGGTINVQGTNTASAFTWTIPASTDTFVGLAATQTLTNKTLTSPVISGGSVDNATIGATTQSSGKFTTLTSSSDATLHGLTVGLGGGSYSSNTALGVNALNATNTGGYTTAVGNAALQSNTSGAWNSAFGFGALNGNSSGSYNTAVGGYAMPNNTTASNNTALGYSAGYGVTGTSNIMVGFNAGNGPTTLSSGTNNLHIGNSTSASSASVSYEIIIGSASGSTGKGASTGYINPNSGGVYQGNNSTLWSVTSDERLKKNIVDNTVGLTAINGIKIRNFEYRLPDEITDLDKSNAVNLVGTQLGVIAQELQQVLPDCVKTESTGVMSVDSSDVVWHMVNAIKELNTLTTTQAETISTMQAALKAANIAGF
jgi:hypothetical protein